MSTNMERWPVNPPPGGRPEDLSAGGLADDLLGGAPFDATPVEASSPAQRIAAARTTAHERGGRDDPGSLRYSPILWISIITLAILTLSGLILWREWRYPPPPPMATPAGVTDDGGRHAGLTVAGSGPVTVEVYLDLLCTQCRAIDAQARPVFDSLLASNRIRLVWHPIGALDDRTNPTGYSTRAANALACAADAGKLRPYADVLFASQPAAASAGLSDDRLIDIAGPVGLNAPSFAACVRDQRYADWVASGGARAAERGVTGIPAIYVDGRPIDELTPQAILSAVG